MAGRRETNVKAASHDDRDLASTSVAFLLAYRPVRSVWACRGKRPYHYHRVKCDNIVFKGRRENRVIVVGRHRMRHGGLSRRQNGTWPMDGSITTVESVGRQPRERPTAYDVCSRRQTVLSSSSLCSDSMARRTLLSIPDISL